MPKLTLLARVSDALPLAACVEEDSNMDQYTSQAKKIFRQLSSNAPKRLSIDSGPFYFLYIIEKDVCYLTLAEKSYPKKLAFSYLEELAKEFDVMFGNQVDTTARPYAFIKFDVFIQKTKKLYIDTRTQRNLTKLNEDLAEVHNIMSRNIQEVLGRGERIETVSNMSSTLAAESRRYMQNAQELNRQALLRKYAPVAVVVLIVLFFLYMKIF